MPFDMALKLSTPVPATSGQAVTSPSHQTALQTPNQPYKPGLDTRGKKNHNPAACRMEPTNTES